MPLSAPQSIELLNLARKTKGFHKKYVTKAMRTTVKNYLRNNRNAEVGAFLEGYLHTMLLNLQDTEWFFKIYFETGNTRPDFLVKLSAEVHAILSDGSLSGTQTTDYLLLLSSAKVIDVDNVFKLSVAMLEKLMPYYSNEKRIESNYDEDTMIFIKTLLNFSKHPLFSSYFILYKWNSYISNLIKQRHCVDVYYMSGLLIGQLFNLQHNQTSRYHHEKLTKFVKKYWKEYAEKELY